MFLACSADDLCLFIYAPVHAPNAPPSFNVVKAVVDHACEGQLDWEFADWMDDGGKDYTSCKVRGRKNADGHFVTRGLKRTLDCKRPCDRD